MTKEEQSFAEGWDPAALVQERGPWLYELYAVLIHSGSALGGHYYAYIRSLEDGQVRSVCD
jgi:ubiquitin carboxyl-terminal hydrolase 47